MLLRLCFVLIFHDIVGSIHVAVAAIVDAVAD